jgi:hypothetical protein
MPQILLQGFPDGASRIGPVVSILKKEKRVTYFVGPDNYFSHSADDKSSFRFAIATLIANRHVKASEAASCLNIPYRTLMNWNRQLSERGADSFFKPRIQRRGEVITLEKAAECGRLLDAGLNIAQAARQAEVGESALYKAIRSGRIPKTDKCINKEVESATTKSERGRLDAKAAEGMGTACTRADERIAAAMGLTHSAAARFEPCKDVSMGGLLAGLPALCANGLFSGLDKHLSLPKGFYTAMHILMLLGFMALGRLRRPESLRHVPPGEIGKVIGLDRAPEVRTLRKKIALLARNGTPGEWMRELSRTWMQAEPQEAGYLYIDGHVRVYHGSAAFLSKRYVSRERLCLRGTTDYWVNDALGRPFFVVSKALTDGLAATLIDEIVPELLTSVPGQPSEHELAADPLLHRFIVIFDREGATHSLLSELWQRRIGAITYRKAATDKWPENEFSEIEVPMPGGESTRMKLSIRETLLSAGKNSIPVLDVRRLTKTGHQTAIITTARRLQDPAIAGRMFSRWCQENYFGYMMQHYDIDGLVQYGSEELPGTLLVINPAWRAIDKAVKDKRTHIRKIYAELGEKVMENGPKDIQLRAERFQDIQALEKDLEELRDQRRAASRKVQISSLPEKERPQQLVPMGKVLTDTVKMIAYRAETALVGLLRPHLAREDEARALIRELFVSSADIEPNTAEGTLTVRIHGFACPAHNKAINALLNDLTNLNFRHPETNMRLIYALF